MLAAIGLRLQLLLVGAGPSKSDGPKKARVKELEPLCLLCVSHKSRFRTLDFLISTLSSRTKLYTLEISFDISPLLCV